MKILDKQKVIIISWFIRTFFYFASGGQVKTSWTHSEREENSPGDQFSLFSQFRISFQGK